MPTTVTPDQVETTVKNALVEFGADEDRLTRDATWEQLDVDSLDLVELAQVVEDEYGVKVDSNDVKLLKNLGDVVDFVVARA
jgi:acyl carrier protein